MDARQARRQLRKDLAISLLAVVSVAIGLYDWTHPRADARFTWLDVLDLAIVAVFIAEFSHGAYRSGDARAYVRRHWYEVPALLPVTGNMAAGAAAVPLLRGLRLVRLVRVFRLLRVVGALARTNAMWHHGLRVARRAHVGGLAVFAALSIGAGAALIWLLESATNPRLGLPRDAVWWAVNMFSNVAYVDFQPATVAGKVVAGVLEFEGIAFIGLFTASLAGAILRDQGEEDRERPPPLE